MDDAVHVEIEVVEFEAVWVGLRGVGYRWFVFDHVHHREWIPLQQPSIE